MDKKPPFHLLKQHLTAQLENILKYKENSARSGVPFNILQPPSSLEDLGFLIQL